MPKLNLTTESGGRVSHELSEETITLGRAPDNAIQIDDPSVSSRHAELKIADKTVQLRDLGSTNGTMVNGATITDAILKHGDRIRFGGVEARFQGDVAMSSTQPLPVAAKVEAKAAETSARPSDFANASPFRARGAKMDATRKAMFVGVAIAVLALLAGMVAVLTMHAP